MVVKNTDQQYVMVTNINSIKVIARKFLSHISQIKPMDSSKQLIKQGKILADYHYTNEHGNEEFYLVIECDYIRLIVQYQTTTRAKELVGMRKQI